MKIRNHDEGTGCLIDLLTAAIILIGFFATFIPCH
jgi:hypothetical protein